MWCSGLPACMRERLRSAPGRVEVRIRVGVELLLAAGAAEIHRSSVDDAAVRRLVAVDRHPADGILRATPQGQAEERRRDEREEDVEHGRVVPGNAPADD